MHEFTLSAFGDEIASDLQTQMDVLEKFGIRRIEMRAVDGQSLVSYDLRRVRELKRRLDDRGFRLSAVGSPLGKIKISDEFEPHLALFRHTLEVAEIMECRFIRMFSFFVPAGEAAAWRDEVMRRWSLFVEAAEGTEVILLHENEKNIYGDTALRCLDLITTVGPSRVKATFDPANFVQCGERTFPEGFDLLKEHIAQVHIKDARSADRSVVPSGLGDGKVEAILSALAASGFHGVLSIEPHLGSYGGISELESDPRIGGLPAGGPRQFAAAAVALERILDRIGAAGEA